MKNDHDEEATLLGLRRKAEAILQAKVIKSPDLSAEELRGLVHELHTYQIELELQSEELRLAQEKLIEANDQYMDLYDFAPVGYLTINDKQMITHANITAATMLGEEREFLLGAPTPRFIAEEDQDSFFKHFRTLSSSRGRHSCELQLRKKDGGRFPALIESVFQHHKEQSDFSIRMTLTDISELRKMQNQIMNARMLESTALLAGGIAHDFNNLLQIIQGNIEMAEKNPTQDRSTAQFLKNAMQACHSAAKLTEKFITFSAGGEPMTTCASVKELLTDTVRLCLVDSDIKYEFGFFQNLFPVEIDLKQMHQVFINVITNAKEAMPDGGTIRINCENIELFESQGEGMFDLQAGNYVKVTIQDHGVGIPGEILPQVFDPYFSTKARGQEKGMGLGLTVANSIMKKHGGAIDIHSQAGSGTTVVLYLPVNPKTLPRSTTPALPGLCPA